MITPLEFIASLRDIYPERYSSPNACLKFHRLMAAIFPDAKGYYDSDHVITEIDGDFYDIDGAVTQIGGYLPIEDFGEDHIENSFTDTLHFE